MLLFNHSTAKVETDRRRLGLKLKPPAPSSDFGRGGAACEATKKKKKSLKKKNSLQTSVFSFKCESVQLTDTVCWTSDLCEYCCAQCCTIRSTAVSILVLLQYVESCSMLMFLSVWPPGGAATVCMPSRSFQVNGLFAAETGWFRNVSVKGKQSVVPATRCFPLRSVEKRLC